MVQTNLFLQWLLSKICNKRKSEILCTLSTTRDRVSNVRSQGGEPVTTPHEMTPTKSRSTDPISLMRISSTSTSEKEKGDEENQIYGGESRKKKE